MKNQKRYAMIGAFVVGALIIASIGVAVFFGGGFGKGKLRALMVFRGNVTGLEIGTPVQFRGMKIGEVKRVRTIYNPEDKHVLFPVYAEFTGTIEVPGYERKSAANIRTAWLHEMVERGLRAQLQTKSFVTGQQMIMLDFVDENAPVYTRLETDLLEIPTVRSPNEKIVETIRELPVRELVVDGQKLLANVNALLSDPDGKPGPLTSALTDLASASRSLEKRLPEVTDELLATGGEVRKTLAGARGALNTVADASGRIQRQIDKSGGNFDAGVRDIQALAQSAQRTIAQVDQVMARVEQSMGRGRDHAGARGIQSFGRLAAGLFTDQRPGRDHRRRPFAALDARRRVAPPRVADLRAASLKRGEPHDHRPTNPAVAAVLSGLLLAGCGNLISSSQSRMYALDAVPATRKVPCPIGFSIREVRVAGHLDRDELVLMRDGPEIRASADDVWAAPLKTELPRVLTRLLLARLDGSVSVPYPWRFNEQPGLALNVEIDRLEPVNGELAATMRWTVVQPTTTPARVLNRGTFETRVPLEGPGPTAAVRAIDTALGRFADALAELGASDPGARAACAQAQGTRLAGGDK